ncbi:MAG: DJ-1 family glyoxalase III [Paludibacteraceae bacterium]|nr:DJ-1/PfpI family protein [Prevotellaceae bacterium]
MVKIFVFLAAGFEETEALAPTDVLRRAGFETVLVSVMGQLAVTGSHGITVMADSLFEETDFSEGIMLVLPGGMPGTRNLEGYSPLISLIDKFAKEGKKLAAICAAPSIFGNMGLLKGKEATCYPGYEDTLKGAEFKKENVVVSGQFVTARGAAVSVEFGLRLLEVLLSRDRAVNMSYKMVYTYPLSW